MQAERKELLERFNHVSQTAEEATVRLESLPELQNLCRRLEEERNAAILDNEAKNKLL